MTHLKAVESDDRTDDSRTTDQHATLGEDEFKEQLVETIPHLRAFGYSLCGRMDLADDLVQDTMLKAWNARERFKAGTSMRAWTFVILRNGYISQMRRAKFSAPYDEYAAECTLAAPAAQQDPLHLADVHRALQALNQDQREAIILVGAGGFSYEEAAAICDCATGTMKSRVSRARQSLEAMMNGDASGQLDKSDTRDGDAMGAIFRIMDRLTHGGEAAAA
ncbi:MAG: sigma-70 family RNA polymerase sigma factor [Blastomonas sp.]